MKPIIAAVLIAPVAAGLTLPAWREPALPATGFGGAVAVAAGQVFVGEPANLSRPGIVYVFRRDGGEWRETAQVMASDGAVGDQFGTAVAPGAGFLVVGAPATDSARGTVYVFRQDAGGWMEAARLTAPDRMAGDRFGAAVAVSGDAIVVGAPARSERAGAAHVFRRVGGTWRHEAELTVGAEGNAALGSAVALDGDLALLGAPGDGEAPGVVHVFRRANGSWTAVGTLGPSGEAAGARFGSALASSGGVALVGAPRLDASSGRVYTFRLDAAGGTWTETATLAAPDGERQFRFGMSVALDGGDAIVGAPGATRFAGAVYAVRWDGGAWSAPARLAAGEQSGDFFGGALALAGAVAVVGVPGDDYSEGTAAVYARDTGEWRLTGTLLSEALGMAPIAGSQVDCADGVAAGFDCADMDIVSFLPLQDMGAARGVRLNDVWGWTDPATGKEYALVGRLDGTSFVDVSDPSHPRYLGDLPKTEGSPGSSWRDIKVYRDHAFIVSDGAGEHGMQVFDLTQLRDVDAPVTFEPTARYDRIHSAHNIVINEATGFAFTVGNGAGGETCGGGLHIIDIRDPKRPAFAGCFAHEGTGRQGTGYTHDAQCVVYEGPDAEHRGKEICFGANETALSIADVSNKDAAVALASAEYPNVAYSHQGWLSEDQRYFFMNDELDELSAKVERTRTLVWDVGDLDDPVLLTEYFATFNATDHNLYVRGDLMYQTNNSAGLRVLDVSDPAKPVEVAFFDTTPYGDNGPGFNGTWSSYPFFESGIVVVSSRREGLFLLKKRATQLVP
jgi:choice-of-anchor B domain-containing protein